MSRFFGGRTFGGRYWAGRFFGGAAAAGGGATATTNPVPLFGWPLWSDSSVSYTVTLSGGSWRAALPLSRVVDRRMAKFARSTDATLLSTQFEVDLGVARSVGVLALPKHTMGLTAAVRWRGSNNAGSFGSPVYDSGWRAAWPSGVSIEDAHGINVATVHIPTTPQTARYWLCEISDTGNAAGYIDLHRVVIAGAWYPSTGIAPGARIGAEDDTVRTVTEGGAAFYLEKRIRRTWDFAIPDLGETEALTRAWKLQRQLGKHGQLFFVFDANDTLMHERAFLCVMRDVNPIELAAAAYHAATFRLLEEL